MVLDVVVCATLEVFGNIGPAIIELIVEENKSPLLLIAPTNFLVQGIQVIVPALSALLAHATCELPCDEGPVVGTLLLDILYDHSVFVGGPPALGLRLSLARFLKGRFAGGGNRC